jgi:hypothetical protein
VPVIGGAGSFAQVSAQNQFLKTNLFNGPNVPGQNYTGMAADFSGTVDDTPLNGGVFARTSEVCTFTGGTNGARGDAVTSAAANSTGSTQFIGHYLTEGLQGGVGFVGKGSANGYLFQGHMAVHASGAYAEMGGFVSQITNDRPGALIEGGEFSVTLTQQAKASAFTALMVDNIGVSGLASYNWHRGIWIGSVGSQVSGDALYVDGAGGWTNFAFFKDTTGAQRFRMDATGKMFIGANGQTLYDGSGGLQTDAVLIANNGLFTNGTAFVGNLAWAAGSTHKVQWGSGSPAGVVTADRGSIWLRVDGGASTTMYVKESGDGTNTGWVAK